MKRLDHFHALHAGLHHAAHEFPAQWDIYRCAHEIKVWHLDPNRDGGPFDDIGYHFLIKGSRFIPCRSLVYRGAHIKGFNDRSVGFCVCGDFSKRSPTSAEVSAVVSAIFEAERTIGHKLTPVGHNQFNNTFCPGPDLVRLVNDRIHQVRTHSGV
ncbi:peptidoglycan recognition family protein [uncultured Tateyamaria sp.]|uniref:peptidoglycan recognition protein family protein n=1 Tax=uncultured Tateyamaria sp. TaxID=455651 RepID=UPI002626B8A1|nr:peptidoglycan recognition family protein [uncultured Tateyamaria sp.]